MPEIKNTFLSGKMNKDLDERLIPKGEYRDALNLDLSTSESDDVGSLQNTYGNTVQSTVSSYIPGAKCIGSVVDKENDKIYWFISGTNIDAIAEYDFATGAIAPVIVDSPFIITNGTFTGNATDWIFVHPEWTYNDNNIKCTAGNGDIVRQSYDNFQIGATYKLIYSLSDYSGSGDVLPRMFDSAGHTQNFTVRSSDGDNIEQEVTFAFDSSPASSSYWNFFEFKGRSTFNGIIDNVSLQRTDNARKFLKFDSDTLITGINILDGLLFWTDGINEPKKINIERCKKGSWIEQNTVESDVITSLMKEKNWTVTTKLIAYNQSQGDIQEKDITVIKRYPTSAPTMVMSKTSKPSSSIITATCTLPINTTYSSTGHTWADSSGSSYENLQGWLYGKLVQDARYTVNYNNDAASQKAYIQLNPEGAQFVHTTGNFTRLIPSLSQVGKQTNSFLPPIEDADGLLSGKLIPNDVATWSDEESYNWWNGLENKVHAYSIHSSIATELAFADESVYVDKITDRIYFDVAFGDKLTAANDSYLGDDYFTTDSIFVLGNFYGFNNESFWTYINDAGLEKVKPAGTSNEQLILPDGTILKDNPGAQTTSTLTVTVPGNNPNLDAGWAASNDGNSYIGTVTSTTSTVYPNVSDYVYIDNVATAVEDGKWYDIRAVFEVTTSANDSGAWDCGWSFWNGVSSSTEPQTYAGTQGFRVGLTDTAGTYILGGLVRGSLTAGNPATFRIFKHEDAVVNVTSIQITPALSSDVKIQPITFDGNPDYEKGDIIEMTNTNTVGDEEVKVRVELMDEIDKPNTNTFPKTWAKGHQVGAALIDETTFVVGTSGDTWTLTNVTLPSSAHLQTAAGSGAGTAEYHNVSLDAGTYYQIEYEVANSTTTDQTVNTERLYLHEMAREDGGASDHHVILNQTNGTHKFTFKCGGDTGTTKKLKLGFDDATALQVESVKVYKIITETTQSTTLVSTTSDVTLSTANADIVPGMHVSGNGIPDGTTVTAINVGSVATAITLSVAPVLDSTETLTYTVNTAIGTYGSNENKKIFNAKIRYISDKVMGLTLSERRFWNCELLHPESFYDVVFPRFAYRWKYIDGEYSAISAFTEAAFLPGDTFKYDAKEAYNLAMVNRVNRVELSGFERVPKDVTEIDILYTESTFINIYTLRTIKDISSWDKKIIITKDQIRGAIESNQMLRHYDNVPRKAKAQEITANRLVYGNYTHLYDLTTLEEPNISLGLSSSFVPMGTVAKSIKSGRNYQIGAAWLDQYGRQTPVFTNKDCLVNLINDYSNAGNLFLGAITNTPPTWATHYKYYVKDSANEYYNIAMDRFYQGDNEEHVWLSFPSKDRNKVVMEDYLVLKKTHGSNDPIDTSTNQPPKAPGSVKYKIIDIKNEAPEYITKVRKRIGDRIMNTNPATTTPMPNAGLHFFTQTSYGGAAANWPIVGSSKFRIKGSVIAQLPALEEAVQDDHTVFDRYIRVGKAEAGVELEFSRYYKVLSVERTAGSTQAFNTDDSFYEFILLDKFGDDVAGILGSNSTSYPSASNATDPEGRKLFLEYFTRKFDETSSEFAGKFFVKILKDYTFEKEIAKKNKQGDDAKTTVASQEAHWIHVYDSNIGTNQQHAGTHTNPDGTVGFTNFAPTHVTATDLDESLVHQEYFKWSIMKGAYSASTAHSGGTNHTGLQYGDGDGDGINRGHSFPQFASGGSNAALFGSAAGNADPTGGAASDYPENTSRHKFGYPTWTHANGIGTDGNIFNGTMSTAWTYGRATSHNCYTTWDGNGNVVAFDRTSSSPTEGNHAREPHMNPYTRSWIGTYNEWDYSGSTSVWSLAYPWNSNDQRFCIDQGWCWEAEDSEGTDMAGKDTTLYPATGFLGYTADENVNYGKGFKIGQDICSFRFICFGSYLNSSTSSLADDYNNFAQNNGGNSRAQKDVKWDNPSYWQQHGPTGCDNWKMFSKLRTVGTRFKWADDPTATEYIVQEVQHFFVRNYASSSVNWSSVNGVGSGRNYSYQAEPDRQNMGYRLILKLNKPIVWSPTASTYNGSSVTPIDRLKSAGGGTSTLQILEYMPGESTYSHENPAVFEVEPKEKTDLNLFYETAKSHMLFKDNMKLEILNNNNVNDSSFGTLINSQTGGITYPGNWLGVETPPGTTYAPPGNTNGTALATSARIKVDNTCKANEFIIPTESWGIFDLPKGVTVRITSLDSNGNDEFFKEFPLPSNTTAGSTSKITIEHDNIIWHNCWAFGNGVESDRLRDDFNAAKLDKGPRVSTTLDEPYAEETRKSGLIYSGIYNSQSGTNRLNQFIMAEKITKSLNPEYGSIQKLFTRNYDLLTFCEDKVLRVLSRKDALFNADGNMQLTATNNVLGQAVPFAGEYGISKNPESLADYGYRVYFTDRNRGVVLRLSQDGITPISEYGMSNYFKIKFSKATTVFGSYDEDKDIYNVTLDNSTISFTEKTNGWTSFKSFLPESGLSLNGTYYTFKNGEIWKHNINSVRNNFYNTQYESSVKFVFNDAPSIIKSFNTLSYEGSQSREYEKTAGEENQVVKKGWYTSSIESDKQSGQVPQFKEKEGKWFNNIIGIDSDETNIDLKEFTSQGLGQLSNINLGNYGDFKTLKITALYPQSSPTISLIGAKSAYHDGSTLTQNSPSGVYAEDVENTTTKWEIQSINQARWTEHIGTNTKYYLTDWISGLVDGNTYHISANITGLTNTNNKFIGFATDNMESSSDTRVTKTNNSIFTDFVYSAGANDNGIYIQKPESTAGTISNIQCVNTTPQVDNVKWTVNTSATDRSSTSVNISNNYEVGQLVGVSTAVEHYFYIHGQTVNGIKYAVKAANFTASRGSYGDMVIDGGFDSIQDLTTGSSANWTSSVPPGTGSTPAAGSWVIGSTGEATHTAGAATFLLQDMTLVEGQEYTITMDVTGGTAGILLTSVLAGGGNVILDMPSGSTGTATATWTQGSNMTQLNIYQDSTGTRVIDNISIVPTSNITIDQPTNQGTPGEYDNVVRFKITVKYFSADPFPSTNQESFITFSGTPEEATDQ